MSHLFLLFAGNHESCHENIHLGWVTYLCGFAGISDRRTPSTRGFPQVRISILAKFACSFAHFATAASASCNQCNQDGEVLLSSSQPCLRASESSCSNLALRARSLSISVSLPATCSPDAWSMASEMESIVSSRCPQSHRGNLTDRAELPFYLGQITKFGVYGCSQINPVLAVR